MKYVRLGRSGLKVSPICLGCMSFGTPGKGRVTWSLGYDEALPIVSRAVEAGVSFFDTADTYSLGVSEELTGKLVRATMPRDRAVIATKVLNPTVANPGPNDIGLSRKHILDAVDQSLRRLGTDYIDLYIIHRFHRGTPIEETMATLHGLVQSGKVRYLGASSMYGWQFAQMQAVAERNGWTKFISMQNLYNVIWREERHDMNAFCIESGVGLTPWSPLAGGFATVDWRETDAKHSARATAATAYSSRAYGTPGDYRVVDAIKAASSRLDAPMAQISMAWLLAQPGVTSPIVGATKLGHIEDAIAATTLKLPPEVLADLDAAYEPVRRLGMLS
ncbi:aldo/keto reductase [Frigidibacter albus]|uniref:Aldo/keto reductase n=1 Tax=Frigidibacter albus TaxID=1465486 RepID=A0A6L8VP29_9RHOB|nr:aldo/keto reductase [Frigidibacter albus]MZQ91099.1 aldo/keto reductase [Frigidibacter albus]NBE32984.1 aldo/keto reductase [Frigidibacter albus]GGH62780.1 oxidoreductase [Frigidibacter albus]